MNDLIEAGQRISAADYPQALDLQVDLSRSMERFTGNFDVFVTLSNAGEVPLRQVEETHDSALMWTLTYLPAISAPVFKSPSGLPFDLQLVARRYNDPLLLKFVAEAIERGHLPATSHLQRYGEPSTLKVQQALVLAPEPALL